MNNKGLQQKTQRKMQFQIKKAGTLKNMSEKARISGYGLGRERRESAI